MKQVITIMTIKIFRLPRMRKMRGTISDCQFSANFTTLSSSHQDGTHTNERRIKFPIQRCIENLVPSLKIFRYSGLNVPHVSAPVLIVVIAWYYRHSLASLVYRLPRRFTCLLDISVNVTLISSLLHSFKTQYYNLSL